MQLSCSYLLFPVNKVEADNRSSLERVGKYFNTYEYNNPINTFTLEYDEITGFRMLRFKTHLH